MGNCAQPAKSDTPKAGEKQKKTKSSPSTQTMDVSKSSQEVKKIPESEMENTLGLKSYDAHDPVMLKLSRHLNAHVKMGDDDTSIGIRWEGDAKNIFVGYVTPQTPAWIAGVESGLKLIDIDGVEIKTKKELTVAVAQIKLHKGGCIRLTRTYSLSDLAEHNNPNDCWVAINGQVYDVTNYVKLHPGGSQVLLSRAGTDATGPFEKLKHSARARALLDEYCIGCLTKTKPDRFSSFPSDTETL